MRLTPLELRQEFARLSLSVGAQQSGPASRSIGKTGPLNRRPVHGCLPIDPPRFYQGALDASQWITVEPSAAVLVNTM